MATHSLQWGIRFIIGTRTKLNSSSGLPAGVVADSNIHWNTARPNRSDILPVLQYSVFQCSSFRCSSVPVFQFAVERFFGRAVSRSSLFRGRAVFRSSCVSVEQFSVEQFPGRALSGRTVSGRAVFALSSA